MVCIVLSSLSCICSLGLAGCTFFFNAIMFVVGLYRIRFIMFFDINFNV